MKLFTIGCSFTEGQGLEYQSFECYTTKLAEKLNLEYFNFGSSGMSNDYIFRKVFELINSKIIKKEDIILIQWTHYFRKELSILFNDHNWYHSVPNSFHAYQDKKIIEFQSEKSVQNEYYGQLLEKERIKIESNNKKLLEKYITQFLNKDYQLNTTINYINALYTYLEYNGYKHLHFFGWDECIIDSIFLDKPKFLIESFGGYTNTDTSHSSPNHPDKIQHKIWADFLCKKIIKLKYNEEFEIQLINYRNNLYRLKYEIEKDIENSNDKIIEEKKLILENEIEKLKEEGKKNIEKELEQQSIELNILKQKIQEEIKKEQLELENIIKRKPKTLI